jgi:hypothetical protein
VKITSFNSLDLSLRTKKRKAFSLVVGVSVFSLFISLNFESLRVENLEVNEMGREEVRFRDCEKRSQKEMRTEILRRTLDPDKSLLRNDE